MSNEIIKKDIKEYIQSEPTQLKLFDLSDQNSDDYSNTMEMYDCLPKHYFGGVEREKGKTLEGLPVLTREFVYRGKEFRINISPAALVDQKSGKTIHYYPSQREELVEDVIRKLASKRKGVYLDNDMAVKFTYYEVEQELLKIGHGYATKDIKQAIEVCSKSVIEIISKEGNQVSRTSAIFPLVGKETVVGKGKSEKVVVMFHPLVTKSIDEGTYRAINYERLMRLKMPLARWLHRRISHLFSQATVSNPYQIKLSTIVRDSGMKNYKNISDTIKQVQKALDQLKECRTVGSWVALPPQKEKNKILDVTFSLFMSEEFVADVKKANKLVSLRFNSENLPEEIEFEKLRQKMENKIFGLPVIYINNVIAKVRNKEDWKTVMMALDAAENYINSTPKCIPAAIVKSAIRDGWSPRKDEIISATPSKEIEKISLEQKELAEMRMILQENPVWIKICATIKKDFSKEIYQKWFSELKLFALDQEEIIISAPTKFCRDWIIREFIETKNEKDNLKNLVKKLYPNIKKIAVICNSA